MTVTESKRSIGGKVDGEENGIYARCKMRGEEAAAVVVVAAAVVVVSRSRSFDLISGRIKNH